MNTYNYIIFSILQGDKKRDVPPTWNEADKRQKLSNAVSTAFSTGYGKPHDHAQLLSKWLRMKS
jgi:hypothetical protein